MPNFMDEPTAGLDVGARERMLDILREYMEEEPERSILISSHISSDLEHLCDDIYVGTTIGSHTGPGTVALFFWGDTRTE